MRASIPGFIVAAFVIAGCGVNATIPAAETNATTPAATATTTTTPAATASAHHLTPEAPKPSPSASEVATAAAPAPIAPDAATASATPEGVAAEVPRYRDVTIPSGTTLTLALTSGVSSKASSVEDAVNASLRRALVVDGVTVVPAGSAVSGYVTEATRSGRVKGRARVGFRFTSLRAGETRYTIRTAAIARQARGTKKEDAVKIGIGAGAGAIVGAIAGGKKGAAIGSAVGGGGGTGVVLATRGEEVALGPGAVVTTRLTAPLTVRMRR